MTFEFTHIPELAININLGKSTGLKEKYVKLEREYLFGQKKNGHCSFQRAINKQPNFFCSLKEAHYLAKCSLEC